MALNIKCTTCNISYQIYNASDDHNGVKLDTEYENNEGFVNASYIHVSRDDFFLSNAC